jgi:hypothetical protein
LRHGRSEPLVVIEDQSLQNIHLGIGGLLDLVELEEQLNSQGTAYRLA